MCGRVICALSSDELLKIAKAKAINNSMKYRKSYNIGPERYLAGIFKKNTNRNFKEKEMDIIDKEESQENNQKIFAINNIEKSSEDSEKNQNKSQEGLTNNAENEKENLYLDSFSAKETKAKDINKSKVL